MTTHSLTPTELFDHRLAALLGFTEIEVMKRSMSQRSYIGWQRYWEAEPWGPWRDNLHTAVLAREVRRPYVKSGTRILLDQFFYKSIGDRREEGLKGFFGFLQTVAKVVRKGDRR